MQKVNNELEALELCKEHQCTIEFRKADTNGIPEHCIVTLNAWTKIIGKDLVEAVNRMTDVYHSTPINYPQLEWWDEQKYFYSVHNRRVNS